MNVTKGMVALLAAVMLAACGGGGSDAGDSPFDDGDGTNNGGPTGQPAITLSLSSSTVTAGAPATVSAVLTDETGAGIAGQVVRFSTDGGLGTLSASSALTDATGTAAVSLTPASADGSGADEVVATATVNGAEVEARRGFQLTATSVTISSFTSDTDSLGALGQTTLTVTLDGASAATPVSIELSSACVAKGKATLTPTSATTSTGEATFTYRDQGCGATDASDSLQASVTGTTATASLSIGLTSPEASSIIFVSASRPTIYLKGSGFDETSEVTFQVRDADGNGLANQSVLLEPTTLTGGLTLDGGSEPVTVESDSDGNVIVRVNSGTVPTPVRIKATLVDDDTVSTVSSNLSIAVGLPSQLNFSLSQATRNIEGYDIDGTENTYSIIASDRLGNPVPDDTAINFITEGGSIEASKRTTTVNGLARASANFLSAEPRPEDGRVTILAYALGEESFLDVNGNNVFGSGEDFQDLGNVYLDRLYDGFYDEDFDQFVSLSLSGTAACNAPSSDLLDLDISIPSIAGTCDGEWGGAYVRRSIETVFSTSGARPVWYSTPANPDAPEGLHNSSAAACQASKVELITGYAADGSGPLTHEFYTFGSGTLYGISGAGIFSFAVSDANPVRFNPMAAGTTISVNTTDGLSAEVEGGSPVPSSTEATFVSISYEFTAPTTSGTITVTFTSPSGLATSIGLALSTDAAPGGQVACP